MQFNIKSEKENKLFNRKEVEVELEADMTPSQEEVKNLVAEKLSTQPENIRIKKIAGKFGSKVFAVSANVYDSEENLKKTEFFSKKELEKQKQAEVKEEPAEPEPVVEEKPAEEVKEEPVKEVPEEDNQEVEEDKEKTKEEGKEEGK